MIQHQRGATLIVVLIMLVLLTIIGTWAIRQSMVSLNITTNSQAQQLLMQSSDTVFYRLGHGGYAASSGNPLSLIGYSTQNEGDEVVFCFRNQSNSAMFNVSNSSVLRWNEAMSDVSVDGVSGFCSLSNDGDYASARKAQLTQVSVIVSPPSDSDQDIPLSNANVGTDTESIGQPSDTKKITVYSTSLLPALSSTDLTDEIHLCLRRPHTAPLVGNAQTISSCLKDIGVPYNTQIQSYIFDAYQRAES